MQFGERRNTLTFHNISETMKLKRSSRNQTCCFHPGKKGKYLNRESNVTYCTSCAIQEASRGALIEQVTKMDNKQNRTNSLLEEEFKKAQEEIEKNIHQYNHKFQSLLEALTDMQIRDILIFNKKLEENQLLYQSVKQRYIGNLDILQLKLALKNQCSELVINKLDQLVHTVNQYLQPKQFYHPSLSVTNASINLPSNYNEQIKQIKTSSNSLKEIGINSQIQKNRLSFHKSQNNTNSFKSKNSTIEQFKKSNFQDTPESIKSKISSNNLKVTNDMAVTMFEKINICESINLLDISADDEVDIVKKVHMNEKDILEGRESLKSVKSRYRYDKSNNLQTER